MQQPADPFHLNIHLGEKQVRTQHAYTWDQALEIHDLVFASAQEALDSNALIAFPIQQRVPTQAGREIIDPNADNPSTLAASYATDDRTPGTGILQLAAAAAVIAAGTGIGIAAVVAVIGLAWG